MLKCFKVRNYKNFANELVFDFGKTGGYKFNDDCLINGYIGKGIIYGRNATGKTNLANAIDDISYIMFGTPIIRRRQRIVNADSDDTKVYFDYGFVFGKDEVTYSYSRAEDYSLFDEELKINNKCIYQFSRTDLGFKIIDLESIGIESLQIDKYTSLMSKGDADSEEGEEDTGWYNKPFLRYLLANSALDTEHVLSRLQDFIARMRFVSVNDQMTFYRARMGSDRFAENLDNTGRLQDFEDFLNAMGVKCKISIAKTIDGQYELYFDHKIPIPFWENTSSGTLSLASFYRRYIAPLRNPSFVFMDEFDAFYHYEMSEKLVRFLKTKYKDCQVLLTTHNTNLMNNQIMRPDCLFILSTEGKLTPLCDATERELREGHNLEKMYISGEFEKYE